MGTLTIQPGIGRDIHVGDGVPKLDLTRRSSLLLVFYNYFSYWGTSGARDLCL